MKILKGRLHIVFKDLVVGETFVNDNRPYIKVSPSAGSKVPTTYNTVRLDTGTLFVTNPDDGVVKIDLGITGLESIED